MYQPPLLSFAAQPEKNAYFLALIEKKGSLPDAVKKRVSAKALSKLKSSGAFKGERGAGAFFHEESGTVVFGLGDLERFTPQDAWELGELIGKQLAHECVSEAHVSFPSALKDGNAMANFLKGLSLANHKIDEFKTKKKDEATELKRITVDAAAKKSLVLEELDKLRAIVPGIAFARGLAELPSSTGTPEGLIGRFIDAVENRLEVEVWDEKRIQREGMGLLLAVSRGSPTPPRFLIMRYGRAHGKSSKNETLYLVGKGVTFDTGGINLKTSPWKELVWMKKDMAGAAAVMGAMLSISALQPKIQVVGVAPLTSNAIGSHAILPGDIFKSYSGKTVEIQNTDAEGRLILADAIHFAVKEKASYIVDVATLTGACAVALGPYNTGLFSNHAGFEKQVKDAASDCGEPAWPMPMSHRYGEELSSGLADLSNMGAGRDGGAILGAKFLENFVAKTRWAHLDIAGSCDLTSLASPGTSVKAAGRMVHTLVELACRLAS